MTGNDRKAEIRRRMADTGESYSEARRRIIEAQPRTQAGSESEKVYVSYTLTRDGALEFDGTVWANALGSERQRMVEETVAEELDSEFDLYGAQGIAECVENGDLKFDAKTQAEADAAWDAEAIETALLAYAGIGEYDEWPDGLTRPVASDSYVSVHGGVEYVVLRRQRSIVAVYDIDSGAYNRLETWPKEIERR
jgi:hypothetical protein